MSGQIDKWLLKLTGLVILWLICGILGGCSLKVFDWKIITIESTGKPDNIFYVLDQEDIVEVSIGDMVGQWKADRHGWVVSDEYMEEAMQAKVER